MAELPNVGERWRRRADGRMYEVESVSPHFGGHVQLRALPKGRLHWLMAENLPKRYDHVRTEESA